jgi:hypothetical protein
VSEFGDSSRGGSISSIESAAKAEGEQAPEDVSGDCPAVQPPETCPPHDWLVHEEKGGDTANAGIQRNKDNAKELEGKPSRANQKRGYEFEAKAICKNAKRKNIDAVGRTYICSKCGQDQEIDIVFEDGQIAECSSRNFKGVTKGKSAQRKRQREIQASLNNEVKPLAKLDRNLGDADQSAQYLREAGFEVEGIR